jgi:hypothetical protein
VEPGAPRGVTRRPVLQQQRTLRANSCTDQRPKPADESRLIDEIGVTAAVTPIGAIR